MYRHMSERTVYPPSRAVFTKSSATENHSSNTLPLHTPGAAIASVGKHLPITFLLCESKIWRGSWRAPDMCSKGEHEDCFEGENIVCSCVRLYFIASTTKLFRGIDRF
ncbi:hypothetical protein TNCT_491051 [Trichonephila clavata]|uniref:Uncharacterized protein n=1 Tax=Trichonephila clavata TaxID=2740835 RepID=A0A8X6J340_TRICU|nr:hypothetical protein TNCT_491051 [Trichonephila clavata]